MDEDEKNLLGKEFIEYIKDDEFTDLKNDNITNNEHINESANDIKEDFSKDIIINDFNNISKLQEEEKIENNIDTKYDNKPSLNNETNPFIKTMTLNKDIEIISEASSEESEKEENKDKDNSYIIDSKFIDEEGKIKLNNNLYCYKSLKYDGKNMFYLQKKIY